MDINLVLKFFDKLILILKIPSRDYQVKHGLSLFIFSFCWYFHVIQLFLKLNVGLLLISKELFGLFKLLSQNTYLVQSLLQIVIQGLRCFGLFRQLIFQFFDLIIFLAQLQIFKSVRMFLFLRLLFNLRL